MEQSHGSFPGGSAHEAGDGTYEHPIEGLMRTAMESIKGMIDVNTVVGQAVETRDGGTIIPISRVSFGFAAGGGEYFAKSPAAEPHPFGGGSGAGVTVHPVGFLVVKGDSVRLLSVDRGDLVESVMNTAPQLLDQIQDLVTRMRGRTAPALNDDGTSH